MGFRHPVTSKTMRRLAQQANPISKPALGMVADQTVGRKAGEFVLAGALTAPIESMIATAGIPFLSDAVSPTGMGAYAYNNGMGRYVPGGGFDIGEWQANGAGGVGAYVQPEAVAYGDGMGGYFN